MINSTKGEISRLLLWKQRLNEYIKIAEDRTLTGSGVSEVLGLANFAGDPSNLYEHSVYAEPIPTPAPKATDAQRVTGLPDMKKTRVHPSYTQY